MGKYIAVNGISDVVELLLVHDCSFMPYLSLTDCTKYYMCIKLSYTIYVEYDNCMCSKPLNGKCDYVSTLCMFGNFSWLISFTKLINHSEIPSGSQAA